MGRDPWPGCHGVIPASVGHPMSCQGCAGGAGDKITEGNKPLESLPRDKRWKAKCFKCSQIAVLGWGGERKSSENGVWRSGL